MKRRNWLLCMVPVLAVGAAAVCGAGRHVATAARPPRASVRAPKSETRNRAPAGPSEIVRLGVGASLGGKRVFPADNPWNQDVSGEPIDPNSDRLIASIGADLSLHPDFGTRWQGAPNGIPYVVVPGTQPRVPVRFRYADE